MGGAAPSYSGRRTAVLAGASLDEEPAMEETPFGELVFSARVMVEYSVERK